MPMPTKRHAGHVNTLARDTRPVFVHPTYDHIPVAYRRATSAFKAMAAEAVAAYYASLKKGA